MNKEQLNQKLIEAIEGEDVNKAKILIEKGADVNARDKEDISVLSLTAQNNLLDIAKLLIEKGADVNETDKFLGATALAWVSVYDDKTEVAKLLIENGADVNATDKFGNSILTSTKNRKKNKIIKFLIENGAKE